MYLSRTLVEKIIAFSLCCVFSVIVWNLFIQSKSENLVDAIATLDAIQNSKLVEVWSADPFYVGYLYLLRPLALGIPWIIGINVITALALFVAIPFNSHLIIGSILFTSSFAFVSGVINQHKALLFILILYLLEVSSRRWSAQWVLALPFNLKSALLIILLRLQNLVLSLNLSSWSSIKKILYASFIFAIIGLIIATSPFFLSSFASYQELAQYNLFDPSELPYKACFCGLLFALTLRKISSFEKTFNIVSVFLCSGFLYFSSLVLLDRFLQLTICYLSIQFCSLRSGKYTFSILCKDIVFALCNIIVLSKSSLFE